MARLINLHHPMEQVWDKYAKFRFERHFDEYFSRPLTHSLDMTVVDWVEKVVNGGEGDIVVFVSHPSLCPWMALKTKLARTVSKHKLFGMAEEHHGKATEEWRAIADMAMVQTFDGMFTSSAWHQYKLTQQGWPEEKLHFAGYPVDPDRHKPEEPERNVVSVANADDNMDFILDVIEHLIISAELENLTPITFDLSMPDLKSTTPKQILQDLRILRLQKEGKDKIITRWVTTPEGSRTLPKYPKIILAPASRDSFDRNVAHLVMNGAHPVVPNTGCYMEMVRMDLSRDRYSYQEEDIRSCANAILTGLASPSPPKKYIEAYSTAFDQISETMLGE